MVIEDVSDPGRPRTGNVIVRPEAVGICGSDFHLFSGDVGALSGARDFYPRIQGHEVSAVIGDLSEDANGLHEGDRVAIFPLLPCGTCYPCRTAARTSAPGSGWSACTSTAAWPNGSRSPPTSVFATGDLDADGTAFVEPASIAVHALARGRLRPGEQVVVFGAGPIGLATVLAAVQAGARVLRHRPDRNPP